MLFNYLRVEKNQTVDDTRSRTLQQKKWKIPDSIYSKLCTIFKSLHFEWNQCSYFQCQIYNSNILFKTVWKWYMATIRRQLKRNEDFFHFISFTPPLDGRTVSAYFVTVRNRKKMCCSWREKNGKRKNRKREGKDVNRNNTTWMVTMMVTVLNEKDSIWIALQMLANEIQMDFWRKYSTLTFGTLLRIT